MRAVSPREAMLYVGTVWEGSTCLARMRVLQRLGYNVNAFDVTPYLRRGSRLLRAAQHRLNRGPAVAAFNRDLREFYNSITNSVDYGKGLNGAKIGLCLLSKLIPETSTTRSFEIPGSSTFMLAERTEKHGELFEEGKEAEFFSSEEELSGKISYYLKNSEKRAAIAKCGYRRCIDSGYSNHYALAKIMGIVGGCAKRQQRAA